MAVKSKRASGTESKSLAQLKPHEAPFQVNIEEPIQILLDLKSDPETPSPVTLCFDAHPKRLCTPLHARATELQDSDDSDSDTESPTSVDDEAQDIAILPGSQFYTPHSPPSFRTTFELPTIPQLPSSEDHSTSEADKPQYIIIPSNSPFYTPPSPPRFQATFDLPTIPVSQHIRRTGR